jgi:hypothetical protein
MIGGHAWDMSGEMVGAYLDMCARWYRICAVGLGFVCVVFGRADCYSIFASPCISSLFSRLPFSSTVKTVRFTIFASNSNNAQPSARLEQPGSWNPRRRCALTTLARSRQCTQSSSAIRLWGSPHLPDSITKVASHPRAPKSGPKIRAST